MKVLNKIGGLLGFACLNFGALQAAQYLVTIQAENGQYLCAENGGGSYISANRNYAGSWETFVIDDSLGSGNGWSLSIKSTENPKFLCWNNPHAAGYYFAGEGNYYLYNNNPSLVINRDYAGWWETFHFADPWNAGSPSVLDSGWVNARLRTSAEAWSWNGQYYYAILGTYLRAQNGGGGSMDGVGGTKSNTGFYYAQGLTGTRFAITVLAVLP